jgi:hypothetical protein
VWEKADEETKAKLRTKRVQLKLTERELTAEEKGLPALKEALDGYQFPQGAHTVSKYGYRYIGSTSRIYYTAFWLGKTVRKDL